MNTAIVRSNAARPSPAAEQPLDVGEMATAAGLRDPVRLTPAAWRACTADAQAVDRPPDPVAGSVRVWQVLQALVAAARHGRSGEAVGLTVFVRPTTSDGPPRAVALRAVWCPGSDGYLGVTVMLAEEE